MNIIKINDNSGKLFYIGGVVRDELLGRDSFDIDITYVGNAIEYCSKFGEVVQVNPDFGTVRVEVRKAGGQEVKPLKVESGKLKVESLSLYAPSPDGERICGRTERSESGLRKDGAYCGEATNAELLEQRANSRQGWDGVISNDNSENLQEQQLDKNFSTLQPFNPSTSSPSPQPSPSRGEGACHDNPSTFQPFNLSTKNNLAAPIIDFASTRSESYPKKGHLPVVEKIGCSLKEDVLRRDFTINALAKSVTTGEIVDYTGGLEDLKNKKLRVLHDGSFIDDPTRIIRGLKFSIRFGFDLEEHTKQLQDEYLANINYDMSYKRVKKELMETFNLNSQFAFNKFINEKIYKLVTPNDVELPKVNIEGLVKEYIFEGWQLTVESGKLKVESLSSQTPSPDGERICGRTERSESGLRKDGAYCGEATNAELLEQRANSRQGWDGVISNDNSENLQEQQLDKNPSTLQPFNLSTNNCHTSIPPYLYTSVWLIYVGVLKDLSRLPLTKTEQKILDDVPQTDLKTDFEIYKAFEGKRIETILLYAILKNEKVARHYLDNLRQIKIEITGNDLKNMGIPPSPKYQEIFDEVLKEKLQNPKMTKEDEIKYLKNLNNEL